MKFSKIVLAAMTMIIGISAGTHIQAAYSTWAEFEAKGGSAVVLFGSIISTNVRAVSTASAAIGQVASDALGIQRLLQNLNDSVLTSPKATDLYNVVTRDAYQPGINSLPALCEAIDGLANALTAKFALADKPAADAAVKALAAARVPEAIEALVLKLNTQFVLVFVTPAQLETAKSGVLSAFFAATTRLANVSDVLRAAEEARVKAEEKKAREAEKLQKNKRQTERAAAVRQRLTKLVKENLSLKYRVWYWLWLKKVGKSVEDLMKLRKELQELQLTVDTVGASAAELDGIKSEIMQRLNLLLKPQDELEAAAVLVAQLMEQYKK